MPNKRIFQVQGLVSNGVSIGGLASLDFDAAYKDVIQSTPDGAVGAEDVDRAGLRVAASLQCSDVAKMNAVLDSAPGSTSFSGKESGASTWHNYVVQSILWSGMNLSMSKNADGGLGMDGVVRFADGTKDLQDAITLAAAEATPPTLTYPARLYRPNTASFDPDGAADAIAPLHVESVNLTVNGNVLEDYGDTDIGQTAVDLAGWNPLQVTLVIRDASDPGAEAGDIASKIIAAARGALTVALLGRAGAADKTLTVNNLVFTGVRASHSADYTEFTLTGSAGWRSNFAPGTVYTLNATDKLFEIA